MGLVPYQFINRHNSATPVVWYF